VTGALVQADKETQLPSQEISCGVVLRGPPATVLQCLHAAQKDGLRLLQVRQAAKVEVLTGEEVQKLKNQIKGLSRQLNIARGKLTVLEAKGARR